MTAEELLRKDWYSVLEASPSDAPHELRRKYQRLALLYHPDKQSPDLAAEQVQRHMQRFIEVDQAWKILGNEETKRVYDLQRRAKELKQSWPVDAHICLGDMSWDDEEQVYTYNCRCGGLYIIGIEEAEVESVICCDTCSLSIEVQRAS
ncbi:dnaJ homolog subfamily C member 24 [Scleropages formosus]|nr:dnaJ homolog subfamily C member 24 [Scleropages formosus]XP_018619436.1 dnaJ homolog subfamily C member 24 [Scleropages formosus]XP_018619437.1 dnaJ homolog subfamily C member 24 [Scleropages formosus]XP_018619438.1 dnaJ homolog subfamily C member 24 [Scleropages formosus]